jgi:hypothetical protein
MLQDHVTVSQMPYRTRSVRFLELWEWFGWRIKVYGITTHGGMPRPELLLASKARARDRLPIPAVNKDHYGIGYMIVHEGAVGDYGFINWWYMEDIVQHHMYGASKGKSLEYRYPEGAGYCVWELAVIWFERQAWVETVLKHGLPTDFTAYLERRMNEDV